MISWQPTATMAALKQRADIVAKIRQFFAERDVLEVDTPLLSRATVTDPHVLSIPALFQPSGSTQVENLYLQTSPEYAMKRLLAAGSGSIYQICKAFRQGDLGRFHQPEFSMLEWYRVGFDHHDLMNEMDALLQKILHTSPAERITYAALFEKHVGVNPHVATVEELKVCVNTHCDIAEYAFSQINDQNFYLDILLTHCIEPHLGKDRPVFIYDFPQFQAALAKIRYEENPPVASRFEVYFKGIELANGFHELQNATEQRARFQKDLTYRKTHHIPWVPIDETFLAALTSGLPDCAGVALGLDRLFMAALQVDCIQQSVAFGFDRLPAC